MQIERIALSGDPAALARELRALVPAPESVADEVAAIIARVRANRDDALRYYTRQFDTGGSTPSALRVPEAELDTAAKRLSADVGSGLDHAITNVMRVAEAWLGPARDVNFGGHEVPKASVTRMHRSDHDRQADYHLHPSIHRPARTLRLGRRSSTRGPQSLC